jgi:tetratricopeptide (TPR) repeat protein
LWTILIAFCVAASISLTAEISQRFLAVRADFLSVFSTLSQVTLTLLAGSPLTNAGRDGLRQVLSSLGVASRLHQRWMAGLSLAMFIVILGLWGLLPTISRGYNAHGMQRQAAHRLTDAIEDYRRAISLNHDNAIAQYNLATAYEDVFDYDQAMEAYRMTLRADDRAYGAYNNLARLYLLRANATDWGLALKLLEQALKLNPADSAVRYSLFKNRGWAALGLKLYGQAEQDLRQALTLRPDGAAAYCLLGQLCSDTGRLDEAASAWESCLGFAAGDFVEPSWLAQAREALNHRGQSK